MAQYRISDVAERTGFAPSTLRYYEDVGLITPERTGAGYRLYDDRALERLRFIARAKQLGCTLEETEQLVTAWDEDCDGVRSRLLALVQAKVTAALRQTAELVVFTGQLQRAAASLEREAPSTPCDESCVCLTDELDEAVACTLPAGEVPQRMADWQSVLDRVVDRTPIDGGVRLSLAPGTPLPDVAALVQAEQKCCAFFSFALTVDGRGTGLEVRAPATATDAVTALFGAGSESGQDAS
jgi:MerR family copper efflux transcriptional regulator